MHQSAHENGKLFFEIYCKSPGCNVLDVGSHDVNGSLRECKHEGMNYTGTDLEEGPNVDVVMPAPDKIPFDDNSFDAVVTTSAFEHVAYFWLLLLEIFRVTRPDGYIYINAPSNGAFHQYPFDYWRFYPDAALAFVEWGRKNGHTVSLVESGISAQGSEQWNDFVAVLQKSDRASHREDFISKRRASFYNVRLYNSAEILNFRTRTEDQQKLDTLEAELIRTRRQLSETENRLRDLKTEFSQLLGRIQAVRWLPGFLRKRIMQPEIRI